MTGWRQRCSHENARDLAIGCALNGKIRNAVGDDNDGNDGNDADDDHDDDDHEAQGFYKGTIWVPGQS